MQTAEERRLFYQFKYENYRKYAFWVMIISCMLMPVYFIADSIIVGDYSIGTIIPRVFILIPMELFVLLHWKKKFYSVMVPASYGLLFLEIWITTWIFATFPDKRLYSEAYIVFQMALFAIGFCAPSSFALWMHFLFLGTIMSTAFFFCADNTALFLAFNIPCLVAITIAQYLHQRFFYSQYKTLASNQEMQKIDALTGAYNRNFLDKILHMDGNQLGEEYSVPVSVLMFDIDSFQQINERYGYTVGDQVLKYAVSLAKECIPTGIVIRWLGDKFLVVLPGTDHDKAYEQADAFRMEVEQKENDCCPVTVSVGIADYLDNFQEAVDKADKALRRAKMGGRNRVQSGLNVMNCLETVQEGKEILSNFIFEAFSESSDTHYMYLINVKTGLSRWSLSAVEYFNLPGEYFVDDGRVWLKNIHPDDRKQYRTEMLAVLNGQKKECVLKCRVRNYEGKYIIVTIKGHLLKGDVTRPDFFAGIVENHGIIDSIDHVTGLYNNYEMMNMMEEIIHEKTPSVLMMVGIIHFQNINDLYGYAFGDMVLRLFAEKLKERTKNIGSIFRCDGARFAFCIKKDDLYVIQSLYTQIREIAEKEIYINEIHVALSIGGGGIVINNFDSPTNYFKASASYALTQSKEVRFGELVMIEDRQNHEEQTYYLQMLSEISRDISQNFEGFYLKYQPIVNAQKGNKIYGVEALLRWQNEEMGTVGPMKFISWLENEPNYLRLGIWILRTAMIEMKPFADRDPDFIININVSYNQLASTDFLNTLIQMVHEVGFPRNQLCLEVTERCYKMEVEKLRKMVQILHEEGFKVALDDFGTEAATVSLFSNIDFDEIKIDKSFLGKLETNERYQAIVEMIIRCAERMNTYVCVEGVEDRNLKEYLSKYPRLLHQGYYYSRPVLAKQLGEALDRIQKLH